MLAALAKAGGTNPIRDQPVGILVIPFIVVSLTAVLTFGFVRFREPADVALVVLAAPGLVDLISRVRPRGQPSPSPADAWLLTRPARPLRFRRIADVGRGAMGTPLNTPSEQTRFAQRVRRGLRGILCAGAGSLALAAGSTGSAVAAAPTVTLQLGTHAGSIPGQFFGVSLEMNRVAGLAGAGSVFDRLLTLIHPGDGQPMPLRLGGRSADSTIWGKKPATAPRWVTAVDSNWMATLADLVRRDDLRLDLDLNLAVHSPSMATTFALAAKQAMPRGTFAGVAIGNEPDLYRKQPSLEKERLATTARDTPAHWTVHYNADKYVHDFLAYERALLRKLPGLSIAGPELTFPSLEWPTKLVALGRERPSDLSFHRYATATCTSRQRRQVPDAAAFLENRFSGGLARTLSTDLRFAAASGVPLRVTEMNSFTCGGRGTLARSFATALWAPDALFEMAAMGVAGVNWHIRPELPNAPFSISAVGATIHPEAYGLAIFARMIGPNAQLIRVRSDAPTALGIKAWAVASSHRTRLLILNKGPHPVLSLVHAIHHHAATVSRLLASSPAALTGETFAGQTIGPDGLWHGRRVTDRVAVSHGLYQVGVPAYSAALVDL